MVAAIGAIATVTTPVQGVSIGGLRIELARNEKTLSECVNCASARTAEGQQEIQRLSSEIARLKTRIAEATKSAPAQDRQSASGTQPASDRLPDHAGATATQASDATVGGRIDILA